jgi:glucose/arabinose dehydrogenase
MRAGLLVIPWRVHAAFTDRSDNQHMTKKNYLISLLVLIAVIVAGYFAFQYLKEKPPSFLIELLTKTKPPPALPAGDLAPFRAPEGFTATIYSRDVPGARVMTRDPKGAMLVSETKEGKVVALPDLDGDGKADSTVTVLEGLDQPHGILVHCPGTGNASADQDACMLYVAETGALKAYAYDADTYRATAPETLATFPTGSGHFTRTLLMHPDGKRLLISVGSSCNVCDETDAKRATVQQLDLATGQMSTFATGLRNTVFMATNPVDGSVWGTDNGRDVIGDEIPPDEVNVIEEGKAYGWPVCYGKNIQDTDFDSRQYFVSPCANSTPSYIDLPAHSAALGLAFIPEEGWPEDMRHDLLIAYHGSWNRSDPTGYKVVRMDLDQDAAYRGGAASDFLSGFLPEGAKEDEALGRPVGVMAEPGGVAYISDDRSGAIYRIALDEPAY